MRARAKSMGLVDVVTQERHVRNAVRDAVAGKLRRAKPGLLDGIMRAGPVRPILANRMRAEAKKSALPQHYPAPYALIDLWEKHGGDFKEMLAAERPSFAKLMVTSAAQNSDPRLLPARADEEAGGRRLEDRARACRRRRCDGRRHRRLVRLSRSHRDARRHEAGADRGDAQARLRSLSQIAQAQHRHARCA